MSPMRWMGCVLLTAGLGAAACNGDVITTAGSTSTASSSTSTGTGGADTTTSVTTTTTTTTTSVTTTTGVGGAGGVGGSGGALPFCGDGQVDALGEQCDGADFAGTTCESLGLDPGVLSCNADCTIDASKCIAPCTHDKCVQGPGLVAACDPCVAQVCMSDPFCCGNKWDMVCIKKVNQVCGAGLCPVCGDGQVLPPEQCDGMSLDGASCMSLGFVGGTLSCKFDCTFNTTKCNSCGNGMIDGAEACDGADLGGKTCLSLGYTGGTLGCQASCILDVSQCEGVPACAHSKCVTGPKLDPVCDPCVATICMADPFCCNGTWDNLCVNKVNQACGAGTCP